MSIASDKNAQAQRAWHREFALRIAAGLAAKALWSVVRTAARVCGL
ncbi:hypothetical protein ACQEWB_14195 [Streptomyces sp. CA-249302]